MSKSIDKDGFLSRMLRSGDAQAVSILYKQYFREVVQIAYDVVKDKETAKDIAQELFIAIWEKRRELDLKKSMKEYLMRSARNQALYYMRENPTGSQLRLSDIKDHSFLFAGSGYRKDKEIEFQELKMRIHRIIEKLPPTCKKVYQLSRYEKMTNAQVAERMNLSIKTVEKHITRALNTIRNALKDHLKLLLVLILG